MSKLMKIAVILAVAAVAIAAKQFASPSDKAALSMTASPSISPSELTHRSGYLPELKIENLF